MTLGAYAHQDLPFEKLLEALQPERSLGYMPLFQAMFTLQNTPPGALELPGIVLSALEAHSGTAKFDLTLSLMDTDQALIATSEYNTELFGVGTITRMLGHFKPLLEGIIAEPKQRLATIPFLTEGQRVQTLVEWNNTQAGYSKDSSNHELVEAQVERMPDAVAIIVEDEQLTYAELNAHADRLAHYLRRMGVGPGVLVGICMEHSLEMVVSIR